MGNRIISVDKTLSLIVWINELKYSDVVFRINVSVMEYSDSIKLKLDEFSYSSNTFDSNIWTTYNIDPTDKTVPSLKINLKDGDILSGEILIEISSNDVVTGFLKIGSEYKKDLAFINKSSIKFDSTTIVNGKYTLSIELMDINHNKASLSISIEINNPEEESGAGISGFDILSFFLIFVILVPLYSNKKH